MGMGLSPDLPPADISVQRAQGRSSNAALTAARFHDRSSGRPIGRDYKVDCSKVLGQGRQSTIYRVRGLINERPCAVKMFRTPAMSSEARCLLTAEVEIHLTVDHPNIVRLYDVYEDAFTETVYLVMEYCSGGELFYELSHKGRFSELEAAEATWQMLHAVSYLHNHNVVHRDIKLENFLFADSEKRTLKLIDFGFAKVWDGHEKMQATCGTPDYVSPEVLKGEGYTSQCDMWSLGVLVFMLLSGCAPIYGERREQLQAKIIRGEVSWDQLTTRCTLSAEAMDFLRSLLVLDPEERLNPQTALLHPWMLKTKAARVDSITVPPNMFRSLQLYAYAPPLRRAVLQLVAQQLSQEEVAELTEVFLLLSRSGRGTISLEEQQDTIPEMRLFAVLDVNQDGEVYYSDFLAATLSSLPSLREEVLRKAFSCLDVAMAGSAGSQELWAVFRGSFEGVDTETMLEDICYYGGERGQSIDFEVFKKIVDGHDTGFSNRFEDPDHLPALFPAPKSPRAPRRAPSPSRSSDLKMDGFERSPGIRTWLLRSPQLGRKAGSPEASPCQAEAKEHLRPTAHWLARPLVH